MDTSISVRDNFRFSESPGKIKIVQLNGRETYFELSNPAKIQFDEIHKWLCDNTHGTPWSALLISEVKTFVQYGLNDPHQSLLVANQSLIPYYNNYMSLRMTLDVSLMFKLNFYEQFDRNSTHQI